MVMNAPFVNTSKLGKSASAQASLDADMEHARLGVLYIFGNTHANAGLGRILLSGSSALIGGGLQGAGAMTETPTLGYSGTGVKGAGFALGEIAKLLERKVAPDSGNGPGPARTLWERLIAFFDGVVKWAGGVYQGMKVNPFAWGAGMKTVVHAVVANIVDAAVPLGGAFDVVKGVSQATKAGFTQLRSWLAAKSVPFRDGHTAAIIEAVQQAMSRSLGEGLWIALKGSAQIGLDLAVAGVGTLAKAIASGLEMVVKYAMRVSEVQIVDNFRQDAARAWRTRNTAKWHKDGPRFNAWFRDYALAVPAIGAVALNSGYCGGPMQYLNMYPTGGQPISQKQFDGGVKMLSRLKGFSKDYLNATAALGFGSPDKVVHAALDAAKNYGGTPKIHGGKRSIRQNKASDMIYGLLTG